MAVIRTLLFAGTSVNLTTVRLGMHRTGRGLLKHGTQRAGSVYPLDGLWFVRVSDVVGRWYARVYGV
jgi:hypothetical protein